PLEHLNILADLIEFRELPVAGNDLYVGRQHWDDFLAGCDHALHASTRAHIDEGKAVADIVVTHMHNVGLWEEDDGVAVRVSRGKVQCPDVFSVEVHSHVMVEGDNGQGAFLSRLHVHRD